MPGLDRVAVEVDVRVEVLAFAVLVRAAAEIPGVVTQIGDAGEGADQVEEGARLDGIVQRGVGGAELANLLHRGLAAQLAVLVARIAALEGRELRQQRFGGGGVEETVDDHVAEGIAALELRRQRGQSRGHIGIQHGA